MKTAELLLAFNVRTLAVEMHSKARAAFFQTTYDRIENVLKSGALSEWDKTHPMEMYIVAALHELRDISKQIQPFIQP